MRYFPSQNGAKPIQNLTIKPDISGENDPDSQKCLAPRPGFGSWERSFSAAAGCLLEGCRSSTSLQLSMTLSGRAKGDLKVDRRKECGL